MTVPCRCDATSSITNLSGGVRSPSERDSQTFQGLSLRSERPFTGVSGPSGPKIAKKSQKESFWGSAKKSPKIPEKVKKYTQNWTLLGVFFDFFGYFRGLFCGPPKRLFLRLFCDFGPGGPGDSCKWSLGSQRLSGLLLELK